METGRYDTDVVIVGGGPAGSAAAIACVARGLRVLLFERERFTRERPGETLHPGIEPVLEQLGISGARLASVTGARHEGIWIDWNGARRFEMFGQDMQGAWRGFQVQRIAFDAMLLARAAEAGAIVRQPCAVSGLLMQEGVVQGVFVNGAPVTARVVVDASGRAQWLRRQLGIDAAPRSPQLIARYGYANGSCPQRDAAPQMNGDASGWIWTAMLRPGTYQWMRVSLNGEKLPADWVPDELRHLAPQGRSRGADVTWRIAGDVARPGWFMVGDAAAVLDPASSHGVLKAILSGVTAAHLIAAVLADKASADAAAHAYHDWLADWFSTDAAQLARFYRDLGVGGFG
ncbi:NAD(P)/FAD-dependent oxidoreductase [Paraburkholderia fungorum]|uniref:NAD(P)/FAD-dependent oxidoreductase n=1 Tax=Paraburkholderia fungorum TaxID=134537 RepID=UPI0038B7BCE7